MKHPSILPLPLPTTTTTLFATTLFATTLALHAAVPLKWTVETSRAVPATFEAYSGETLAFEAALQSYGKPLEAPSDYSLYWQTNGMGNAWWSHTTTPPPTTTNVLFATWSPTNDVGAKAYNCFIGQPGTIYHAAFQLRLRPSPGATPNVLPLPVPVIDFSKVIVLNPPWPTNVTSDVDGAARPLPKYLHALDFDDSYPDAAQEYYRARGNGKANGGCASVRDGNTYSRNFDYPFDDRAEFVVKMSAGEVVGNSGSGTMEGSNSTVPLPTTTTTPTPTTTHRFASVGVAQVGTNLTEAIVTSGKPSRCYKWLPGATVDGINENGVVCNINVVDGEPKDYWPTNGTIHCLGAVRWVLDNATNAASAASVVAAGVYFPSGWAQNFHWMIADERETWIVENGTNYLVTGATGVPPVAVMTNFRLYPRDTTGAGQERYALLADGANITNAWFTRCYSSATNPKWVSEFDGDEDALDAAIALWATKPKEEHRGEVVGNSGSGTMENSSVPLTSTTTTYTWWQTIHTSVYDITNKTMRLAVQEQNDWYTFAVPSAGGVKPEAVREIVQPMIEAAKPGNYGTVSNRAMRVNVHPVWQAPDAWGIRYRAVTTNHYDEAVSVDTNSAGQVFVTRCNAVTQTTAADCWAVGYDLYTGYQPRVVEWTSFGGATITQGGRLTAPSNGWYNVMARADNGTIESKLVPVQVKHYLDGDKVTTYAEDVPSDRKAINDLALSLVSEGEYQGERTASDGRKFDHYTYAIDCPWAARQAGSWGSSYSFAIADHLLANAAHYGLGAIATGPQTIGGVTVTRQRAISLADWARTNGWTDAQIARMNIRDIAIQPCTGEAIPDGDLPYMMDESAATSMLNDRLAGINGWYTTRDVASPQPLTFTSYHGEAWTYSNDAYTKPTDRTTRREDINAAMKAHGTAYSVHVGDSGHPIFYLVPNVGAVVVSHFHTTGSGPSYIRAFPVLKRYCELNGYHMRELTIND